RVAEIHHARWNPAIAVGPSQQHFQLFASGEQPAGSRGGVRAAAMTRLPLITTIVVLAGSAILSAQDPQTGGWRRFGDPAPPQQPIAQNAAQNAAQNGDQNQDPTQPVDRSDSFGPEQQPRPQGAAPAAIPHAYGLPPQVTVPA